MIFSLFKKKKGKAQGSAEGPKNASALKVDLHSHLIPGIDDGAKSMEESMELLRGLEALGYQKVITTPHIMFDAYKNTPRGIREGLTSLQSAAKAEGIEVEIEAAAEYYLDEGFYDHLQSGDVMSVQGKYLLFETSYVSRPLQLEEMIFEIGAAGYTPLMAHPERYRYIKDPDKEYKRLRDLGVLFQVNANSLGGHYGRSAKGLSDFLSKEGMIDFLGSDVHHQRHIETLTGIFQSNSYTAALENNTIRNEELL